MVWLSDNHIYRRLLTINVPEELPSGHPIEFTLSASVDAQGKLRGDYEDIEVVKDSDNTAMNRTVTLQTDGSLRIVFVPTSTISDGDESYYVYYGNPTLAAPPSRDATAIEDYPIVNTHDSGEISFQRPGDYWKEGVSLVAEARATFTGYFDDALITFASGPTKGIAEILQLGEEEWTEVDTFAVSPGAKTHVLEGDNYFDRKHLKIRSSGRSNLSSSGIQIELDSIAVAKPHTCEVASEEVNLDAL